MVVRTCSSCKSASGWLADWLRVLGAVNCWFDGIMRLCTHMKSPVQHWDKQKVICIFTAQSAWSRKKNVWVIKGS